MPEKIIPRGIKSLAANGVVIDREWWLKVRPLVGAHTLHGGARDSDPTLRPCTLPFDHPTPHMPASPPTGGGSG